MAAVTKAGKIRVKFATVMMLPITQAKNSRQPKSALRSS
jgi:hypothetical protein